MRARHAMAIGSLQPEACTCGGRAEATVAHDVASAGRFAASGSRSGSAAVACLASEGGLPACHRQEWRHPEEVRKPQTAQVQLRASRPYRDAAAPEKAALVQE